MKTLVVETKDKSEINQAIDIIALAVGNDPSKVYFFPNTNNRAKHGRFMVQKIFKVSEKHNRIFVCKVGSEIVGASLWFPPGYEISTFSLIKNGLLRMPFLYGFQTFLKIMQSMTISDKNKFAVIGSATPWILFYMGVHPDHQNKGYGAQLLAPILEESDKSGIPIFLENFTDANTRFYERNGFEVKSRYKFDENIEMRNMIRMPGAPNKKIPHG